MRDPKDSVLALRTIRAVAGAAGMDALRELKGGTEIWIPVKVTPDHWMSQLFGFEKALEISRRLTIQNADGRDVCNIGVYISRGETAQEEFSRILDEKVIKMLDEGEGVRKIALALRVTEKRVHNLKRALRLAGDRGIVITEETAPVPTRQELAPQPAASGTRSIRSEKKAADKREYQEHRRKLFEEDHIRRLNRKNAAEKKRKAALECFKQSFNLPQTAMTVGISVGTAARWRLQFIVEGELDPSTPLNRRFSVPRRGVERQPEHHHEVSGPTSNLGPAEATGRLAAPQPEGDCL